MCAIVAPASNASDAACAITAGVTGTSNCFGSVSTPLSAALTTILSALGAAAKQARPTKQQATHISVAEYPA